MLQVFTFHEGRAEKFLVCFQHLPVDMSVPIRNFSNSPRPTTRRPSPGTLPAHPSAAEEPDGARRWIKGIFSQNSSDNSEVKRLEAAQSELRGVLVEEEVTGELVFEESGIGYKLAPGTLQRPAVQQLISTVQDWFNDKLSERRIVVRSLFADLFDGQVLTELLEVLTGEARPFAESRNLQVVATDLETARGEAIQQRRGRLQLAQALEWLEKLLGITRSASLKDETKAKWTPEKIYAKDVTATLHMCVALARHFNCPHPLPDHLIVEIVQVQRLKDRMKQTVINEQITADESGRMQAKTYRHSTAGLPSTERDAFDKLFQQAPEKVETVKVSLLNFVNKHLAKVTWYSRPIEDVGLNFDDGILLIHLLAILGGYFVPLQEYKAKGHSTQLNSLQKVANMGLVFRLMKDDGMEVKGLPDDVVNGDLKSTLRLLYTIYSRYKQ